jgi:hypothetical protein
MHSLSRQLQGSNGAWRSVHVASAYLHRPRKTLIYIVIKEEVNGRHWNVKQTAAEKKEAGKLDTTST